MLKLIKQGGKLEDCVMNQIYGGDDCGLDCSNCGTSGNDYTFYKNYIQWFATSNG